MPPLWDFKVKHLIDILNYWLKLYLIIFNELTFIKLYYWETKMILHHGSKKVKSKQIKEDVSCKCQ